MLSVLLVCLAVGSPPVPSGSKDVVVGVYYAPASLMSGLAVDLAGSASTSLRCASWKLTDGTLAAALCMASTRGVSVGVALDLTGGSATAQHLVANQIVASGGTVWSCSFPRHIANNFLTADGSYTIEGNYYWSPSAVQIGSYLLAVSGTSTAAVCGTTFGTLIASGTVYVPPEEMSVIRAGIGRPGAAVYSPPLRVPRACKRKPGATSSPRGVFCPNAFRHTRRRFPGLPGGQRVVRVRISTRSSASAVLLGGCCLCRGISLRRRAYPGCLV